MAEALRLKAQTMEQEPTDDARAAELLSTPTRPVKSEEEGGSSLESPTPTKSSGCKVQGLSSRETYCLLVWVTHNVETVSALNAAVSTHLWNELIARDICTYWTDHQPSTFAVELLSDMEFLLFKGPWSGWGMTWEDTITYIRHLHGVFSWEGTEVNLVSGSCTMKQAKIDLANTRDYRQAQFLATIANGNAEGHLKAMASDKSVSPSPVPW